MNGFLPRLLAATLIALAALAAAQPLEVAGVRFAPVVRVGNEALQLNGAGIRTWLFFKIYAAGLYVPQRADNADALLAQRGARRVAITMLRSVDAHFVVTSLIDGMRNNHTEAQFAGFKTQIDFLFMSLNAVGEVRKGDVIYLDYLPGVGTRVMLNGQARGSVIAGEDFFTAMLRVWLGGKPVDAELKKGLIGRPDAGYPM